MKNQLTKIKTFINLIHFIHFHAYPLNLLFSESISFAFYLAFSKAYKLF